MKTLVVLLGIAGVALILILSAALFYLGPIVKSAVEKVGPEVTKVSVKLDIAAISTFICSRQQQRFVLGNPPGFKTSEAVKVGTAVLTLVPKSVLSGKVIVRSLRIEEPELTYEPALGGSNIGRGLENIQSVASQEKSGATNTSSSKALQVDEFLITGGKIN